MRIIKDDDMLKDLIKTTIVMDNELLNNWNSIIEILYNNHIINTTEVDGNLGYKYRGDLYGLFLELEVPPEFIYPHIIVNGYSNSSDYDGIQLSFRTIDTSILRTYYKMFTRSKK